MHALRYGDGTLILTPKRPETIVNEDWKYQKR